MWVLRAGGGSESEGVECILWGVGVGRFDGVGLRIFLIWFPGCWGVGNPWFDSRSSVVGMFEWCMGRGLLRRGGGSLRAGLVGSGFVLAEGRAVSRLGADCWGRCRVVRDGAVRGGGVSSEFECVSEEGSSSSAWVSCSGCLGMVRGEIVATSGEERFLGSPSSPVAVSWAFWLFSLSFANKFFWASLIFPSLLFSFSSDVVVGGCSWGREELR